MSNLDKESKKEVKNKEIKLIDKINYCVNFLLDNKVISKKEYKEIISRLNTNATNIVSKINTKTEEELQAERNKKPVWVKVINFTKQYSSNSKPAVSNLSFDIRKGEFHAFVGANGAGKTTTMKALVGAYAKWKGEIIINGISNQKAQAKKMVGYVPEKAVFPKSFTSIQYLVSMAKMAGLSSQEAKKFANNKLKEMGMEKLANKKPYNFSSGQKKKILLAQALCTNPDILILDEPAANLDPSARMELFNLLKDLQKQGKSIFISSHILAEIGKYADVATILDGGKIVYHGVISQEQDLEEMYSKYVKIGSVHTAKN